MKLRTADRIVHFLGGAFFGASIAGVLASDVHVVTGSLFFGAVTIVVTAIFTSMLRSGFIDNQ